MPSRPEITAVDTVPVTTGTSRERMSLLFVKITAVTSEGAIVVGWGEVCDSYGCSYAGVLAHLVDDVYAPFVIGESATEPDLVSQKVRMFTRRRLGDAWMAVQARAGVDIALWDVAGQIAGQSISGLLGRVRDRVEVYASCGFLEEGPAEHHYETLLPLLERGVRKVKLRTGPEWEPDMEVIRKLRTMFAPGIELMVDGSETYTLPTARRLAKALEEFDVRWLEEPIPQHARAGIESLVTHSPVPIAYGEHLFGMEDAIEAMNRRQLDVLQPDAATVGIGEARRMASAAPGYGVRVVPHVCSGPISLAANLHVAASVPAIRLIEYPPSLIELWDQFGVGAPITLDSIEGGTVPIPDSPGLGVALNVAEAEANPYQLPGSRIAGTTGGLPDRFVGDR